MSPTDYDTWKTGGNIFRCTRCGKRFEEYAASADMCGRCEALAEDEAAEELSEVQDRTARLAVLGLYMVPGPSNIITETRHGLRLTCRNTGAGYEATAEWGSCAGPDAPDSRGSLTVLRLELWRALEDMEAALVYLGDSVDALRCEGGGE